MALCHTLNFRIRMPKAGTSTYNAASRLRGSSTTAPVSKSQALTLHNGSRQQSKACAGKKTPVNLSSEAKFTITRSLSCSV